MPQTPKRFQRVTADAAIKALTCGSRRFLLADEVGLGKTVVAREVITELARRQRGAEPFRVFYFGSGRTVTAQNAPRLVPDKPLIAELCDASRPSLVAMSGIPKADVLIFQFTPETAVPRIHGRGRAGVVLERALLRVLTMKVLGFRLPRTESARDAFRGAASKRGFRRALRVATSQYRAGRLLPGYALSNAFRAAACEVFGTPLPSALSKAVEKDARAFVATLRVVLTRATLHCLPPHLVVFDEFHKYRDRVFALPGEVGADVFLSLLPSRARFSVLLLSATPFRQQQAISRDTEVRADSTDFHRLVGFLHGSRPEGEAAYKKCTDSFARFERALWNHQLDELQAIRRELENTLLRPRMARMERTAFRTEGNGSLGAKHEDPLPDAGDVDVFLRFSAALQNKDKPAALGYWRAIPYPHQFLGDEYVAWRDAARSKWRDLGGVTPDQRTRLRMRPHVPNLRFRQLLAAFPPESLALPWIPPSIPWWPLRGPWTPQTGKQGGLEKGLLFSAYRAVPRSIAGLVSFAVEDWAARERGWRNSKKLAKQSFLAPKSVSVVALFHPSPWLAQLVDPLAPQDRSTKSLMAYATNSILRSLPSNVEYQRKSTRHRPLWRVLPMLEREAGYQALRGSWGIALDDSFGGQVGQALDQMEEAADASDRFISSAELKDLAWFALSAPGVVLLRALLRNWSDATSDDAVAAVTDLSWNGLRLYLDRPWFVARLMSGRAVRGYPAAIQRAVVDGNLEAVLDEHFWLPDPDHENWMPLGRKRGRLKALRHTLGIRSAPVKVFTPGDSRLASFNLSAHAALPLTDTEAHSPAESGVAKLRADDLRQAFNSPFWPHLLCTTSVGQEGLDFHQWCRRVVHWDLCWSPVDVEQREGRIDRFKSLAVRRALAKKLSGDGVALWQTVEKQAQQFEDESGLAPWWTYEGVELERLFFDPPSSEEREKRQRLTRLRELYRLVLGLPHSRDMLARLDALGMSVDEIRGHCLDLGALPRPTPKQKAAKT